MKQSSKNMYMLQLHTVTQVYSFRKFQTHVIYYEMKCVKVEVTITAFFFSVILQFGEVSHSDSNVKGLVLCSWCFALAK